MKIKNLKFKLPCNAVLRHSLVTFSMFPVNTKFIVGFNLLLSDYYILYLLYLKTLILINY